MTELRKDYMRTVQAFEYTLMNYILAHMDMDEITGQSEPNFGQTQEGVRGPE